jgi:hypothetical protein
MPTSDARDILVGETTRKVTLNPHRGSQPVGARRIVGKRKWHLRGRTLSKSSRQRMAPSVIFRTTRFRRIPSKPCGFTISHQGLDHPSRLSLA